VPPLNEPRPGNSSTTTLGASRRSRYQAHVTGPVRVSSQHPQAQVLSDLRQPDSNGLSAVDIECQISSHKISARMVPGDKEPFRLSVKRFHDERWWRDHAIPSQEVDTGSFGRQHAERRPLSPLGSESTAFYGILVKLE
jgi:hypothetical protein